MASFYSTKDSRGYQLRLDVTQGTQSVVNNTSVVSWSLYLVVGSWSFNNYTLSDSLTWVDLESDGTKEWTWPTGSQFSCNGTNKTVLVSSGSKTIAHNADGSKSLTVSASFRTNSATTAYGPTAVLTLSGALVLTTIPRASQPTLSASSAALGEPVIITTNRATADFTHVLTYAIGTQTGAIASGVGASYSWTLPNEIANEIPTAKSGRVVITCKTYNGATLVGTEASSIIATVPNNSTFQPTPSITSITEAVTMPSGITVFVQGKSKLLVISSAVSKYPANNIAQYKVEVLGSSYYGTNVTTSLVMSSGTVPVKFTATDKRGYSGSVIQNVTVYAYSPPSIPTFSAARSPSSQDSNLFVSYGYSVSTTNNQNTLYFAVRYRLAGTSTWTNLATGASPYTLTTTYSGAGILLTDKSYEVGISVSDKWSIATMEVDIGTAFELMNINASGKGIAFGKVSEKNAFEVGMPAEFGSSVSVGAGGNVAPYDSVYNATSGVLIDICPDTPINMVLVEVIGNGYRLPPISTLFQVYHYTPYGVFHNAKQKNMGTALSAGKFLLDGGRLKLWFSQSADYQTFIVRAYTQGGASAKPVVTDAAEPASSYKITCTIE